MVAAIQHAFDAKLTQPLGYEGKLLRPLPGGDYGCHVRVHILNPRIAGGSSLREDGECIIRVVAGTRAREVRDLDRDVWG